MLIIKNPLTLQSISVFGIYSDSLGEKIYGNYQVFGTAIEGEDLIHMTMQEPDIYVGIQNNGPFLVDNQIHADNQIRLELVNQLINRILLYDSPEFTYQDEVFVASVLQKLGVADVNEFMRLVKLHMEKNELTVSLLNKYFEEGREFAGTVSELFESHVYEQQELETIKNEYQSDRYLHNNIFRRLMTAECSNSVYTYQNPVRTRTGVVRSFHDMEWMRLADRIQLSQLRENIFYQTDPAVFCDFFTYEIKPLAVNELTQRKVIGRMSAAILENLANAVSYELRYEYGGTNVWKNYGRLLYGSSENTLERFRFFQSGGEANPAQIREYTVRMNELTRDELHLAQLLEYVNRYDILQENDMLYEDMTRNIVISVLENQNLQKQLAKEIRMVYPAIVWRQPDSYYLEERNTYVDELNRSDRAYRILRQKKNENYFYAGMERQAGDMDIPEEESIPELLAAMGGNIVQSEQRDKTERERTELILKMAAESSDGAKQSVPMQTAHREQTVYEMIREYAASEEASTVPLMENIELLEQINRHNLYMKQLLDSKEPLKDTPRRVVVDRVQARAAALRALEHPEQVLREIYENVAEGKKISDKIPGEIERILSVTDENTRSYYERLMGYRDEKTPPSKSGTEETAKTVTAAYNAGEEAEEKLYLENIGEVLHTMDTDTYENVAEGEKISDKISGEIERILSVTDENTRSYYERLMGYRDEKMPPSESRTEETAKTVVAAYNAREEAEEKLYLETIREVLHTMDTGTYENVAEGKKISDKIPGEIERILSVTDENTRSYYERLMGYRDEKTYLSESGTEGTAKTVVAAYNAREEAEEKLYLETIREVLHTTDTDTRELYRQSVAYQNADIVHSQDASAYERTLTREERERIEDFQKKVYSLLRRIERRESAHRIFRVYAAAQKQEFLEDVQRELLRHEISDFHSVESDEISDFHSVELDEMVSLEYLYTTQREKVSVLHTGEKELQLVHRTREQTSQEVVEEVLETLENSTVLRKNLDEKNEEVLLTQRQLEEIRNEIVAQSREHITHMVERSMKTQMHEISDIVYLELERRLKNEQRRRGY